MTNVFFDIKQIIVFIVTVKGTVVRSNVYHKYIKDLKLNITIDVDGFIY